MLNSPAPPSIDRRRALSASLMLSATAGLAPALARAETTPPALADRADAIVRAAMAASGQPGAAVVVVQDGQVTLARGWGVQRLGAKAPVEASTRFPIASMTKAFTAASLAQLVDEGRIRWTDPVRAHLPGFALSDADVSEAITVRDLLLHVSGLTLGAGDLMVWPFTLHSRAEIVAGLRHLPLSLPLRASYAYDNVLYVAAGELIAAVRGAPLETVFQQKLLTPAGMTDAIALPSQAAKTGTAWPHARLMGAVRGEGPITPLERAIQLGDNALASGGLSLSARDLGRWTQIQLAGGVTPEGARLWSKAQADAMWRPGVIVRVQDGPSAERPDRANFDTYALGWQVSDYRGRRMVWHGGVLPGSMCVVHLIPSLNAGVAILANAEEPTFLRAVGNTLLDHLLGAEEVDWLARLQRHPPRAPARDIPTIEKVEAADTVPHDRLVGTYQDPWYGTVSVYRAKRGLAVDFTKTVGMAGPLEPWAPGVFRTRFDDRNLEDAFLTFDVTAQTVTIRVQAVSKAADFSYDFQDLRLRKIG